MMTGRAVYPTPPDEPLVTARLILEPLVVAHAQALFPLLCDKRLYTYIPQEPPTSADALAERYRRLERRRSPDGQRVWLNWAARLREGLSYVGVFQATIEPDGEAFLAYMIFPAQQRQGYAREGGQRVIEYLAGEYGARLIVAEIDTRNQASVGVVEALGFVRVTERTDADFFKGSVSDEYARVPLRVQARASVNTRGDYAGSA